MSDEPSNEGEAPDREAGWRPLPGGGQGYWDGQRLVAAVPERAEPRLGVPEIIGAVFVGVILAWGAIYAGARVISDEIFVPVKFVVDSQRFDSAQQSLDDLLDR